MRVALLAIALSGCTLATDFDRPVRGSMLPLVPDVAVDAAPPDAGPDAAPDAFVGIDLPTPLPASGIRTANPDVYDACTDACELAQNCMLADDVEPPCRHNPEDVELVRHGCTGTCMASPEILSQGFRGLQTCRDLRRREGALFLARALYCAQDDEPLDAPICEGAMCEVDLGGPSMLAYCTNSRIDDCPATCATLPPAFVQCTAELAFFELQRWRVANPGLIDSEDPEAIQTQERFIFRTFCESLARCAGTAVDLSVFD